MEKTENEWAGGIPKEPKIMDGFDTWGYGGSSGNFQGTFRHSSGRPFCYKMVTPN